MTKRITIIEVKDYVGQEVTIGAWVGVTILILVATGY